MNLIIKTKNLKLTGELRSFIENKIGGLKKFLKRFKEGNSVSFDTFIDIERETLHHRKGEIYKAEAKIVMFKKNLVSIARGENLKNAIVRIKKELEKEIKKYKLKIVEIHRRKERKAKRK